MSLNSRILKLHGNIFLANFISTTLFRFRYFRRSYTFKYKNIIVQQTYLLNLQKKCNSLSRIYMSLSKMRLSLLVVATSAAGYTIAPSFFSITQFTITLFGTCLCASSANALNQILEARYDSLMVRTNKRVLVKGVISKMHALIFASVCSLCGISVLYFGINSIAAMFGACNILLYAFVYTPLKRLTIYNNWLGAIVGAIPPLMGWSAATGGLSSDMLILGSLLFAWQFPHTASLGHCCKHDYLNANYKMMAVLDPQMNFRVGFFYSLLLTPISVAVPMIGITSYWYIADSLMLNAAMAWFGWRFYSKRNTKSSRTLFRYTLIYLPLVLLLIVVNKKVHTKKDNIPT